LKNQLSHAAETELNDFCLVEQRHYVVISTITDVFSSIAESDVATFFNLIIIIHFSLVAVA